MADKKATIVVKKITVVSGGAHGGAWKVAFADFMTAMMAFFLVMWLLSTQSEQGKKAISDYFSTPSVIEYQFQNFGVELTLEKLFLDLINEPLKTLAAFITPSDRTPNVMAMGMKKVVAAYMAERLGAIATNVEVGADQVVFEIPDIIFFNRRTADFTGQFSQVMRDVQSVTQGLADSSLILTSVVYYDDSYRRDVARKLAEHRANILRATIKGYLENESVELSGRFQAIADQRGPQEDKKPSGYIRFEIKQLESKSDGQKQRKLADDVFGQTAESDKSTYQDFVEKLSSKKSRRE